LVKATGTASAQPRQPGGIRAVLLSIAVHGAFFALIVFGVTWQSRPTAPVQAELWDKLPPARVAQAPAEQPEPVKPEPPPPEPPKPEPKPEPPKQEAKPEPPRPDPAIAEKAAREKRELEKRERLEKEKREKLEKAKQEEARRKREQEEADKKKKREEEKARQEKQRQEAEVQKAREAAAAARQSEIGRYRDKIRDKIRGKANVPDTVTGKPAVVVRITILPGGDVLDVAIVRSSGNRIYDAAIERAIRSAQPLPVPSEPELFAQFRDLILNVEHER
jgi:colicin import membrane protein